MLLEHVETGINPPTYKFEFGVIFLFANLLHITFIMKGEFHLEVVLWLHISLLSNISCNMYLGLHNTTILFFGNHIFDNQ